MNKAEYQILEYVVTGEIPLSWLTATNIGELLNKPPHGLSDGELISTILRMFQAGDIKARRTRRLKEIREFVPTLEDIAPVVLGQGWYSSWENSVYYGLTEQGGAKWEEAAKPDWGRFIHDSYGDGAGEFIGMSNSWVEHYLLHLQHDWPKIPQADSEVWDVLEPWQAMYWKTLPIGHRVRFTYTNGGEHPVPIWDRAKYEAEIRWHEEWARMRTWYTRPD